VILLSHTVLLAVGGFFHYLHDNFGKDAVFKLAYAEEEMTAALFEKIFGRDFDALAHGWYEALVALLTTPVDAAQLARGYGEQTLAKYIYGCQAGKDY
jgi:hypothetical protein